ncbi:tRNA lysidine(34) synthetase TilS [Microvirga brassicacearum]|uniref:tRNA(Ile)-lysidine synthase n=1 Tax=Microvirga brassicacearum TaxID=2580413 RepID=A0A5N3PH05_9HYPH|nr:tRNA lysidine(34) synthetase TilS [Microvirga brassicacearum]
MADTAFSGPTLNRLFSGLDKAAAIIAAVSGGPDSIAMMHLLARWNQRSDPCTILVATIDHGLRPEAAEEAVFVAGEASSLGLAHRTLVWTGTKPASRLQERARAARYALLVGLAHETGASHLVTAHTLDDQAETILMRISKGSGLAGLGGMRAERDRDGIRHHRPLLDYPKSALLDLCQAEGWPFVTDPSNTDDRFTRVRWRKVMPVLAAEGLTAERLAELARRVRQAEEALDLKTGEAFLRAKPVPDDTGLTIDAAVLGIEPFEIALRVLMKSLSQAGLALDHSRLQRLETCTARLRDAVLRRQALRMTIAGALLDLGRDGSLRIAPETPRRRGR